MVLDATTLMLFVRPGAAAPVNGAGKPIQFAAERIELAIENMEAQHTKIGIPTPSLSEVLVRTDPANAQRIVELLNKKSAFTILPFDQRAAIEVAEMLRAEPKGKGVAERTVTTWAKLKYDRQIVAIAKVNQAAEIYSDDDDIHTLGTRFKIKVVRTADLELPPEKQQTELPLAPK